ncbi:hypothetical protein B0T10DRAFT_375438, partial [Thelonectria olida]
KERKDTAATDSQAELLSDAIESAAENGLTEPENSPLLETGEFEEDDISASDIFINVISSQEVDDPTINNIEPDLYYDEEPVNLQFADEREDQR